MTTRPSAPHRHDRWPATGRRRLAALALAAATVLAACGADESTDDASADTQGATETVDSDVSIGNDSAESEEMADEMSEAEAAGDAESAESAASGEEGADEAADDVATAGTEPSFRPAQPDPDDPLPIDGLVRSVDDPLSTFALDVDTSSFTQTLSWLESGQRPPTAIVRPEEFVNWPDHRYPEPDEAWGITLDGLTSAPWAEDRALLRVGLRTRSIPDGQRPPTTLVFVVDTSGSMNGRPLQTVKDTLLLLVDQLRPDDRIGLVEYGTSARLLLEPTPLAESDDVVRAIESLQTEGSTNAEEGLALGYRVATESLRPGDATSVVLASDGVANVGATDPDSILRTIGEGTDLGIQLLALGMDEGGFNDDLMERLTNEGNGSTFYVRDERDAQRLFVDRLDGTLVVAAEQSKVQVEVDPRFVEGYRLIGYDNRAVADEDFRDDEVDAGEVGAGHQVTALYELALTGAAAGADDRDVLGTVRLRWEDPRSGEVSEVAEPIVRGALTAATDDASLATAVATTALAELLRGSPHVDWTLEDLSRWTRGIDGIGMDPAVAQAVELAVTAAPAPGG